MVNLLLVVTIQNVNMLKKEEKQVVEVAHCPNCDGMILERKTRRGKTFYGCSNYPKCKTAFLG